SSNATFNAGSSLTLLLNSNTAGTFSQLNVTGTVSLSGSPTLNLTVGFSQLNGLPPANSRFTIISASGGVTGTFSGLADGSSININGNVFRINYSANAVTLTLTTPASANQRFVTQVYLDLLNRPVDASGLTFWSGQLDGGATRSAVVANIERSQEYRTLVVTGIYQTLLHRAPDPGGLNTFVTFLSSGRTIEQVKSSIAGSPEYFQTRGGGNNNGFLTALYQDALNRAIDSGGQTTFTNALNNGASRTDVATTIFGSTEYRQNLVQGYYMHFLRRPADTAGLNGFVNALGAGARDEDVIAAIVGSPEYFGRV